MKKVMILCLASSLLLACKKDNSNKAIDDTPPQIDMSYEDVSPQQCEEIQRGTTFTFKARFTDDTELGSFGVDIHNNFDHHNHSTESDVEECEMDDDQTPENPFVFIANWEIPENKTAYEATATIDIPDDVDTGDYHFLIKVTDKVGWETLKGLSVKIVE